MPLQPENRQSAQQRADRIRAFREELSELQHEDALHLTPQQSEHLDRHLDSILAGLRSRFDVDVDFSEKQLSWGMRTAVTLGGLALCAGLVLFFYRFWGLLSTGTQVALLIAAPLAALAMVDFAARREKTFYFAALAAMVAVALFILDLSALGAIFNVTPSPHTIAAWSIFALALAYQYGLRLLLVVGLVSGTIWTSAAVLAWTGAYWDQFWQRPELILLLAALMFVLALVIPHRRNSEL